MFYSHITLPYYIYCYFQNDLSNKMFIYYNYNKIKEFTVNEYINESSKNEIFEEIKDMFYDLCYHYKFIYRNIIFSLLEEEEKYDLINCSMGLLKLYLLMRFIPKNTDYYKYLYERFKIKVKHFFNKNPKFNHLYQRSIKRHCLNDRSSIIHVRNSYIYDNEEHTEISQINNNTHNNVIQNNDIDSDNETVVDNETI